jgi:hypothetical protein
MPFEELQVFKVYIFFHGVLTSGVLAQVGGLRSWLASQRRAFDFTGSVSTVAVSM